MMLHVFSQRKRWLPTCVGAVLLALLPPACAGDDDDGTPQAPSSGAGGARAGGGGKSGAQSGGKSGASRGGKGGSASAGRPSIEGGAAGNVTEGGAAGEAALSGRGGSGGSGGASAGFCARLRNPPALAGTVAVDFDVLTADLDCRVAGIPWLYVYTPDGSYQRASFLNELIRFNLSLWGCSSTKPTQFSLVYEQGLSEDPRPITSADARALIEDYMSVATRDLQLSPLEAAAVEATLVDLSASVVTLESNEFSRSRCDGGGGEGGMGGEAGAGGQPATGGEAGSGGAGNESGRAP